jgi:uncharacterized protein (DUF2141 family)
MRTRCISNPISFRISRGLVDLSVAGWIFVCLVFQLGCDSTTPPNSEISSPPASSFVSPEPSTQREDSDSPRMIGGTRNVTLQIEVTGFLNANGKCRIAVYSGPEHFNDIEFALRKESFDIVNSRVNCRLEVEIPSGVNASSLESDPWIAVSAYHDENLNSKLDKNSFGIPSEKYGFSGNPKRGFGPPKFRETAIPIPADRTSDSAAVQEISIKIQ